MRDDILISVEKQSSDRSFGVVFTVVFLIVAVLFRDQIVLAAGFAILSALFFLTSMFKPQLLRGPKRIWLRFGDLLHRIISPLILLVIFIVLILPFGVVMQIFKDPLNRRCKKTDGSLWVKTNADRLQPDMRQQF